MTGRIITTDDDVAEGALWLSRREPRFAEALRLTGPWPLRRRPEGFATLLDAIIGQQVSVASASAIRARLEAAGLMRAQPVADASDEALRACGLSRPKLRYAQALAQSGLDYDALRALPDAEALARLTALPGIGLWTAEVYAIQALGRADILAAGDLALQEAARLLFGLDARPTEPQLRSLAQNWAPWRAIAARGLWAYYRLRKSREGMA